MIVRNEEANLAACVGAVADLVQEIVIVDTGSTDRTREIALGLNARVYDLPWADDFSAARNESLRRATGRWSFWLDADDRIDEDNRRRLRSVFAELADPKTAYVMQCLCPKKDQAGVASFDHIRLFPRDPEIRWRYRVHEQILPALEEHGVCCRRTDVNIFHTGYQDHDLLVRKHERNLRLLHLQNQEKPNDPFTIFYLGWTYQELDRLAEAVECFRESLRLASPAATFVPKTYALMTRVLRQMGRPAEALDAAREGLTHFPDEPELLYQHAWMLYLHGDLYGAETHLLRLLQPVPPSETSLSLGVDPGLRSYVTRISLAIVFRDQGRYYEAEAQWQAVLVEKPEVTDALLGLGELYLAQGRWAEMEEILARLEHNPKTMVQGLVLQAQRLLAFRDFDGARAVLATAISLAPKALGPRLVLSRVFWQEGRDRDATIQALRDVLTIDPNHPEARANLSQLS